MNIRFSEFAHRNRIWLPVLLSTIFLSNAYLTSQSGNASAKRASHATGKARTPRLGWNGLVPGVDKLPKAIVKLGQLSRVDKEEGAYYFKNGAIMVALNLNSDTIGRIEVFSSLNDPTLMPKTMKEVFRRYGKLNNMGYNKTSGNTYEKPGLEVLSDLTQAPEGVKMIGFTSPSP
jgi:hypothetical protein